MVCRWVQLLGWVLVAGLWSACGVNDGLVEGTKRFVSQEFNFEVSVSDTMDSAGWFIIREKDGSLSHTYAPPDSSSWEPIAVVVPPASSFPAFAPFNVDIFHPKNPSITPQGLGDLRVAQVGDQLQDRRSITLAGQQAYQLAYLQGVEMIIETYLVRNGVGYSINVLGAPPTSSNAGGFYINVGAYDRVVASFRFLN
ncbi:MAG: hypothetical protein O2954_11635 [bacterium]|nr:hypothetical protein [bacterium]